MKTFLAMIAILVFVPMLAWAQGPDLTITWDPPTQGTDVDRYILQISVSDDAINYTLFSDWEVIIDSVPLVEEYTFEAQYVRYYLARVKAVDASNNEGPWITTETPYYTSLGTEGVPGTPGKPITILVRE
jgi:hypothetical protein